MPIALSAIRNKQLVHAHCQLRSAGDVSGAETCMMSFCLLSMPICMPICVYLSVTQSLYVSLCTVHSLYAPCVCSLCMLSVHSLCVLAVSADFSNLLEAQ